MIAPLFTSDELQENEQRKNNLIKLLCSGEGILMAGAGCTASIYPDWKGFINLLHDEAQKRQQEFPAFDRLKENFLSYADKVKECVTPDRYYHIIFQCFKPDEATTHQKFHEVLCRFLIQGKLKGITTTNYEIVFENALAAVTKKSAESVWIGKSIAPAKIFEFLFALNKGNVPKRIFHLHGIYDQPESIILSENEYAEKYGFQLRTPTTTLFADIQKGNITEQEFAVLIRQHGLAWTQHRKILWSLFATRRLIFMGFSFDDPYFNKMLELVSIDLHTYGYENHYLVLRIKNADEKTKAVAKAKTLKSEYGIETVFFEEDESNTGLEKFVFELEQSVLSPKEGEIPNETDLAADDKNVKDIEEGDEDLTQQLINISRQR